MENTENYLRFISSESYKQQVDIWYRAYNISFEKTELFRDFLISLYELMESTYLGADVLQNQEDQSNHFTWCWVKTIDSFNKEKIFFKEKGNLYNYFWNFFMEAYYFMKLEDNQIVIKEYIKKLFDFSVEKSRSELDMLAEIYKMFDKNLKK